MTIFFYILIAAAIGMGLAKWWRIPSIPMLVVGGLILKVSGLVDDEGILRDALMLGLAFLVFFAGTELTPERLGKHLKASVLIGLTQFFGVAGIGYMISILLGFDWKTATYIALAMSASSTLLVVTLLRQRQQFFEPFGRVVLGVLLVQDFLIIIAIGAIGGVEEGVVGVAHGLFATILLMGLAWICVKWVTPWLLLRLKLDEESLLLVILTILFAFIALAHWMGVNVVIGAFLAGVSLSAFPANGVARGQVASLGDFFLAIFFVSLGASLAWLQPTQMALEALLIAAVVLVTPILVATVARRAGMTSRASIESGLLLAQCSEFSLIIILIGVSNGDIQSEVLNMVVMITVVTMMLTPFISTDAMAWRLMRLRIRRRHHLGEERRDRPQGHVLLLGCGTHGYAHLKRLRNRHERVVVVDDDPATIERLQADGIEAILGDGADYIILRDAGARDAKAILSSMRRTNDNERLLRFVWESRVPVLTRTFGPDAAEQLAVLGAIPVIESEAATDATLAWFDQQFKKPA